MIQDARQAKGLCTVDEFRLYQESLGGRLGRLSPGDLQSRLRRARTLRNKYRGVHRRQEGGARGKMPDGRATEMHDFSRTLQKADLFEHALERFEGRVRSLELERRRQEDEARRKIAGDRRQADQAGRRLKAERADRESHLGLSPDDAGPRSESGGPPPRPGRTIQRVFGQASSGHFSSENRRFQARRDSRR